MFHHNINIVPALLSFGHIQFPKEMMSFDLSTFTSSLSHTHTGYFSSSGSTTTNSHNSNSWTIWFKWSLLDHLNYKFDLLLSIWLCVHSPLYYPSNILCFAGIYPMIMKQLITCFLVITIDNIFLGPRSWEAGIPCDSPVSRSKDYLTECFCIHLWNGGTYNSNCQCSYIRTTFEGIFNSSLRIVKLI